MRFTITYEYDPKQTEYPFWGVITCADPVVNTQICDTSWEKVRVKCIDKIEKIKKQTENSKYIQVPNEEVIEC